MGSDTTTNEICSHLWKQTGQRGKFSQIKIYICGHKTKHLYIPQILDGLYSAAAADTDSQRENVASLYDKECFGATGMNVMQTHAVNMNRYIGMTDD